MSTDKIHLDDVDTYKHLDDVDDFTTTQFDNLLTKAALQSTSNNSSASATDTVNVLYIVIGLAGIFGNLFALTVLVSYRPLRQRIPNFFLINQSLLDLVIGLFLILTMAMTMNNVTGPSFVAYCYLINSRLFFTSTFVASIWNLAALSIERYLSIVHPIRHKLSLTRRKVISVLIGVWIVGLVFKSVMALPTTHVVSGRCILGQYPDLVTTRIGGLVNALGEFFLPLAVIAFCYIQMARAVLKIKASPLSSTNTATNEHMSKVSMNILKILGFISLAFLISVGPRVMYGLKYFLFLQYVDFYGIPYLFCLLLNYSNCCINPIIYAFKYEEFQKGVRFLLCPKRSVVSSASTNAADTDKKVKSVEIGSHNAASSSARNLS